MKSWRSPSVSGERTWLPRQPPRAGSSTFAWKRHLQKPRCGGQSLEEAPKPSGLGLSVWDLGAAPEKSPPKLGEEEGGSGVPLPSPREEWTPFSGHEALQRVGGVGQDVAVQRPGDAQQGEGLLAALFGPQADGAAGLQDAAVRRAFGDEEAADEQAQLRVAGEVLQHLWKERAKGLRGGTVRGWLVHEEEAPNGGWPRCLLALDLPGLGSHAWRAVTLDRFLDSWERGRDPRRKELAFWIACDTGFSPCGIQGIACHPGSDPCPRQAFLVQPLDSCCGGLRGSGSYIDARVALREAAPSSRAILSHHLLTPRISLTSS